MTWKTTRDFKGKLVRWKERLPNNKVLSLSFSVNHWKPGECIIQPHLIVHRPFLRRLTWRKAGSATGNAGFDTWIRVAAIWDSGIEAALALTDRPYVEVQVNAETPELFEIYSNRLERRGYYREDTDDPYMWKTIRNA